ncbi:hypothetical protein SDC9_81166 [bioreactor metagenome]|uniref:Uncharacterized protein n=1 Tax=bioreactor metagenome TaxID=1076179 RepID=A0A644Z121_9ZZZZ
MAARLLTAGCSLQQADGGRVAIELTAVGEQRAVDVAPQGHDAGDDPQDDGDRREDDREQQDPGDDVHHPGPDVEVERAGGGLADEGTAVLVEDPDDQRADEAEPAGADDHGDDR